MIELEKIPHIGEISNHGLYHGARQKNTATFQARSTRQNKLVRSPIDLRDLTERALRTIEIPTNIEVRIEHDLADPIAGKGKSFIGQGEHDDLQQRLAHTDDGRRNARQGSGEFLV